MGSVTLKPTTWPVDSMVETVAFVHAWTGRCTLAVLTPSIVWTRPARTKSHTRIRIVPATSAGQAMGIVTPKPTTWLAATTGETVANAPARTALNTHAAQTASTA